MGGHDPYSSQGRAPSSSPPPTALVLRPPATRRVATARAGNVIGGGDWGADRLVPDVCARGAGAGRRCACATRRHATLAARPRAAGRVPAPRRAACRGPPRAARLELRPGPRTTPGRGLVVERIGELWAERARWGVEPGPRPHEAHWLRLDTVKAHALLGWRPLWNSTPGYRTVDWYARLPRRRRRAATRRSSRCASSPRRVSAARAMPVQRPLPSVPRGAAALRPDAGARAARRLAPADPRSRRRATRRSGSKVFRCDSCGHVQLARDPEPAYYEDYLMTVSHSAQMRAFQQGQAEAFVSRFGLAGHRVIEVGCGDGNYLEILRGLLGVEATGIEPSGPLPRGRHGRRASRARGVRDGRRPRPRRTLRRVRHPRGLRARPRSHRLPEGHPLLAHDGRRRARRGTESGAGAAKNTSASSTSFPTT